MSEERLDVLRAAIRDVPDFPKPGIVFKDITPLLGDPKAMAISIDLLAEAWADKGIDKVVGIESRGFIFGAALAVKMGVGFVPARKPGKLPAETDRVEYALEYGTDVLEMHKDAIPKGARALIVDDLIATGGTAWATAELIRKQGGEVAGATFVVELDFLGGRKRIEGLEIVSLLHY